ncbi:MAG: CARDB domain-containing protein [Thermoplasmata archaeon]|nr:CARDB domain-containing protein [Thermoplasmata archaeon]
MRSINAKSAMALVIISVFLVSSMFVPLESSAQNIKTGNVNIGVMYYDTVTHEVDYISGLTVNLIDYSGHVISSQVSNPIVTFTNVQIGNYILQITPQKIGNYAYSFDYTPIKVTTAGANITNVVVQRTPINQNVNLTIMNKGAPLVGVQVSAYTLYNLEIFSGYTGSKGNITFNATPGSFILVITNNNGGAIKNYYTNINAPYAGSVDLSNFYHIFGMVKDNTTGTLVSSTVRISIFNDQGLWDVLNFNNGIFDFYIYGGPYTIYLTADGYSITSIPYQSGYYVISLGKTYNYYQYNYGFSSDFKYLYMNETFYLNNKTTFQFLPYSSMTILYYQLLFNNMNQYSLQQFFLNSLPIYSNNLVTLSNYTYSLRGSSISAISMNYNGFYVKITSEYYNASVNASNILSENGYIPIYLHVEQNNVYGAQNIYNYSVSIPSNYELSNTVTGASETGYINNLKITNATQSSIELDLKVRKAPEIVLGSNTFIMYWHGMTPGNYILNDSASNFTVVVPANKEISYNVSLAVKDMVRNQYSWTQMTFNWTFDGTLVSSGIGDANVSYSLNPGIHKLNLQVTDVGNNVNSTTITIYSDGAYPASYTYISYLTSPNKYIISWNVYTNNSAYYVYNGTGTSVAVLNNKVVFGQITVDENKEITLNVKSITDTINGVVPSHETTTVIWHINNTKYVGLSVNYTFSYPTRNTNDWINVTYMDQVGNNITVSIPVFVKDTLKPVPVIIFQNSTNATVSQIYENQTIKLNGTNSYDPQNGQIVSYNWTIKSSSGKVLSINSTNFTFISGSLTSSVVTLKFNAYGTYTILLNVSDRSGNYNTTSRTLNVVPVAPDLLLNNVTWHGNLTAGSSTTFYVNVTNTGNAPATKYYLELYVNGKEVSNVTYYNLAVNKTVKLSISWTPSSSGNFTLKFEAYTPQEPTMYLGDNVQTKVVSVQEAGWVLPVTILGIILVIVVLAFIGWRIKKGGSTVTKKQKPQEKEQQKKSSGLLHKKEEK